VIKFLSILSIILAIVLFPPATLALISNNSVPGETTYPIKRILEDGIVKLASITPVTRAWFSVERSNRRFDETTVLIAKGSSFSKTLDELVDQTEVAANEVTKVDSPTQKQELLTKLSESIKKYDEGLVKVQQQISNESAKEIATLPTRQQTAVTKAPVLPSPTAKLKANNTNSLPSPTVPQLTITPQPSNTTPSFSTPAPTAVPSPTIIAHVTATPTSTPTTVPTITPRPQEVTTPTSSHEIEQARRRLEEIQKKLEESRSGNRNIEGHDVRKDDRNLRRR